MMAARSGQLDAVKALLDKGATGRCPRSRLQQTPLMVAARGGHAPTSCKLLIERQARQ